MTSTINNQVLRTLRALEPELRAVGVCHVSVFGSVARGIRYQNIRHNVAKIKDYLARGGGPDNVLAE